MARFSVSKLIKIILKVSAGIIQFAVMLFFVIGLFSAATVVINFATTIESQDAQINFSNTANVSLSLPFYFNNTGLYDVEQLTFTLDFDIYNQTDYYDVLNGSATLPTIPAGDDLNTTVVFDNGKLDLDLLNGMMANSTSYNMTFYVAIEGRYLYGLVPFGMDVNATNIPLNGTGMGM